MTSHDPERSSSDLNIRLKPDISKKAADAILQPVITG